MKELPMSIGKIASLEVIEVDESSPGIVASSRQIREEQIEVFHDLRVVIRAQTSKAQGESPSE